MGQQANSKRRATLDEKKSRAAGRQKNQEMRELSGRETPPRVPGAFGKGGKTNRRTRSPSSHTERRP